MSETCNEKVFNSLFRDLSEDLYRFLYHKFGAGIEANDVVQEAFVALWNNCHKVSPEKAKSYLLTVVTNKTLKEFRKDKVRLKYVTSRGSGGISRSPEEEMEEKEFHDQLIKALEELPERQRQAFLLNRMDNMTHRQIAEELNISQKAVEKRIYKAAASLLKKLGKKI